MKIEKGKIYKDMDGEIYAVTGVHDHKGWFSTKKYATYYKIWGHNLAVHDFQKKISLDKLENIAISEFKEQHMLGSLFILRSDRIGTSYEKMINYIN